MFDMQELDHARVRWQLGHHLFFSFVQSLIITCSRLIDEIAAEEWDAARGTIEDTTHLLWGVSVNFKLTGDFSQAAYEGYVRPNMFEAADGFSGMWSQDHDYLVKQILRRLKPTFQNPPPQLEPSIRTFRQAFAVMYDSHKYVCERFEGEAPSLMMGEDSQKSAGQMIETFKRNRLRTLGVS
ncbi:MAG: hypothetical protein AAF633_18620 [Chloroflexota bacterium]